jgi:hypothetical protein
VHAGPIPQLVTITILGWLAALVLAFVIELFKGRLYLNGLFTTDLNGDGIVDEYHPERVQLILVSTLGIASYAYMVMKAAVASKAPLTVMPEIPDELLMLLGASNTFFLSGKYGRTLKRG